VRAHRVDDAFERMEASIADGNAARAQKRGSADAARRRKEHRSKRVKRVLEVHVRALNRKVTGRSYRKTGAQGSARSD